MENPCVGSSILPLGNEEASERRFFHCRGSDQTALVARRIPACRQAGKTAAIFGQQAESRGAARKLISRGRDETCGRFPAGRQVPLGTKKVRVGRTFLFRVLPKLCRLLLNAFVIGNNLPNAFEDDILLTLTACFIDIE